MDTSLKTCTKCGTSYEQKKSRYGSICRPCLSERDRKYRKREKLSRNIDSAIKATSFGDTLGIKTARRFLDYTFTFYADTTMTHEEFVDRAIIDPDFIACFTEWAISGWRPSHFPRLTKNLKWYPTYALGASSQDES